MNDITLLCLFGMFLLFVLVVLPRFMNSYQNPYGYDPNYDPNEDYGEGRPTYDDPDVEGRGSFGRDRGSSGGRSMNFPWRGGSRGGSRPSVDSPNVRGRGSFGRNKR
jgi:hypothetical protein